MFASIKSRKINILNFVTNKVLNMSGLFSGCTNIISLDLSKLNINEAKDLSFMFSSCKSLSNIIFPNFENNKINNLSGIFKKL